MVGLRGDSSRWARWFSRRTKRVIATSAGLGGAPFTGSHTPVLQGLICGERSGLSARAGVGG